jgi:outer membrane scaffolding protein for murein synthesis (MipA/OmpV family)
MTSAIIIASPAAAQGIDPENTVYSGDYLSIGIGGAFSPSYAGADDYVFTPLPILQGSLGGVGINPRAGGIGLDFVPAGERVDFDLGVAGRLRSDRAVQIKDPVVLGLGKLDRAIEVGPSLGVGFMQVLNPYDSLSFNADILWDVNGAHGGIVVSPGVTYFTPLSQGVAASLTLSSEWADADFHDYYFSVAPAQSLTTGGVLPAFATGGSGFTRAGATLLLGVDLNNDLTDGGWALVAVTGYSRMLGDARRTPFTSVLGSADQWLGALGIGYTF